MTVGDTAFEEVCALEASGQYLLAHDRAMAALAAEPEHQGLRHRAVLTLAQSGAMGPAARLFARLGLAADVAPEIIALGARLLKDQALAGQAGAALAAEAAYAALWRRSGEPWHEVNAAALALLAGVPARARARIEAMGPIPDTGDYWAAATIAEAALLRGDPGRAAAWLATAEARAGTDLNGRRTTRRQLRWVLQLLSGDPALVELLPIPATIHFCGAIPGNLDASDPMPAEALRARLGPLLAGVRFGFGSLAAGADIVIAEALLDAGAELTVVLPFPPDAFLAASVLPAGGDWRPRFAACLARAQVMVLEASRHDELDFAMASHRAMGLARLHAARIDGAVWQLAVPRQGTAEPTGVPGSAGTVADMARWRAAGGETRVVTSPWQGRPPDRDAAPERRRCAVLFGDLPGFGALDDRQLAAFYAGPLHAIGQVVEHATYRNAWGDAVQLVFEDPIQATTCALAIQRALVPEALLGWGLPTNLTPRLALDFGPLRPVWDAVQGTSKFAGRVMTRAARIEPVTPPGMIYATEAFACEMALHPAPPVACDYAGLVAAAKGFGLLPLHAVRPA